MNIPDETLDQLIGEAKTEEDIFGKAGLVKTLSKQIVERIFEQEMTHHLGYAKNDKLGDNSGNSRNGTSSKQVILDNGKIEVEVPRDRNGEFTPQLIEKHKSRLSGIDDVVLSLYGKGMTVRDIQAHIEELYDHQISKDLVSTISKYISLFFGK